MKLIISVFLSLIALTSKAESITVFAASSMHDVINEIAKTWEDKTGQNVVLSFASSSTLARQIEEGAPADIFISANTAWMDYLNEKEHIEPSSRADIAGNQIAILRLESSPPATSDLDGHQFNANFRDAKIAIANVNHVPSGIYARQALTQLGIWDEISDQIIQTNSAQMTVRLVETGEVDYGMAFASDLITKENLYGEILDPALHDKITYQAALIRKPQNHSAEFLSFLSSESARSIFSRHGFINLEAQ